MRYINLRVEDLSGEKFLCSSHTHQGVWLCLLKYTAVCEMGGRIRGCKKWGNERWLKLAGVSKEAVEQKSDLWKWNGEDLEIAFYPYDQEVAVRAKREAGRLYGRGHPKDDPPPVLTIPKKPDPSEKQKKGKLKGKLKGEQSRKEKKGKGKEGESNSWLEPYNRVYEPKANAKLPWGKAGKYLKEVEERIGHEQAVKAFKRYVDGTPLRYFSFARFRDTLAEWMGKGDDEEKYTGSF